MTAFRKTLIAVPTAIALAFVAMITFASATAAAQVAGVDPSTDPSSWGVVLKAVYDAFTGGRYALAAAAGVVALVALIKKYWTTGPAGLFFHSNLGGTLLALAGSVALTLSAALAAPGAAISLSMFWAALLVGVTAAGGYAVLKNVLIDPILKPLAAKAPASMQWMFNAIFWVFDHAPEVTAAQKVAEAAKAGTDAVAAKPSTGVAGVVGAVTELK